MASSARRLAATASAGRRISCCLTALTRPAGPVRSLAGTMRQEVRILVSSSWTLFMILDLSVVRVSAAVKSVHFDLDCTCCRSCPAFLPRSL